MNTSFIKLLPFIPSEGIAIDVGAHHGTWTKLLIKTGSFNKVIAFEPNLDCCSIIKNTIRSESRCELDVVNSALSSESGTVNLYCNSDTATASLLRYNSSDINSENDIKKYSVTVFTLDEYLDNNPENGRLKFLKIDTQGNDLAVIQGGRLSILKHRPIIQAEFIYIPSYQNQCSPKDISETLLGMNYEIYSLNNLHVTPEGRLAFCDAIFIPKELKIPSTPSFFCIDDEISFQTQIQNFSEICAERLHLINFLDEALKKNNEEIKEYHKLNFFLPIARFIRRSTEVFLPRLGNLNQYPPKFFAPDKYILKSPTLIHTPKISIVTPSYQHGRYIEFTINSVLKQTYPNLEFFVQDGGSTDGTLELLKSKEADFTGWVSEKDNGQAQAINRGFAKTSGEIMAWLNSDDLILPGALNIVADFFNRHPDIDVVYGNRLLIDKDNMEIGRWILPGHDDTVLSWVDYIPQETLFWRRRIWEKIGGKVDESFQFALDWDLLVRFRDAGAKFHHIPQFLGAFRIHEKQKTSAQINQIGYQEMNRIRERTLGKNNYQKKISGVIFLYLLKHIVVDIVYRIKTRLKVNT